MNFSLFFSLNTFQPISTLTAVIFLSFSTIRSQISSLKLYAILVSLFFSKLAANESPRKNHLISRFNGFYLFVHFICAHIRNFI